VKGAGSTRRQAGDWLQSRIEHDGPKITLIRT
jgi:hypothetical protein